MAVNLDTLFTKLGPLVKLVNEADAAEGSNKLLDRYNDFLAGLGAVDQFYLSNIVSGRDSARTSMAGIVSSLVAQIANILNAGLTDGGGYGAYKSISDLLATLRWEMGRGARAIQQQVVTIDGGDLTGSASTAQSDVFALPQSGTFTNTGNPHIFLSVNGILKKMTKTSSTVDAVATWLGAAHGAGLLQQGAYADTYAMRVLTDKFNGGTSGAEVLELHGTRPQTSLYGGLWQGAGNRSNLSLFSSGNNNKLSNGGFESVTGSGATLAFTGWTLAVGAAADNLDQDTVTPARGATAVKLLGSGGASMPELQQAVTLKPLTKYLVTFLYKNSAHGSSAKNLKVQLSGTGWVQGGTQGAGECFSVSVVTAQATWKRGYFWINTPIDVPADTVIRIFGDTFTSGGSVTLDEVLVLEAVPQPDGLYVLPVAGTTDPVYGDLWSFVVHNDRTALFQAFFTRFFNFVLPAMDLSGVTVGNIAEPT